MNKNSGKSEVKEEILEKEETAAEAVEEAAEKKLSKKEKRAKKAEDRRKKKIPENETEEERKEREKREEKKKDGTAELSFRERITQLYKDAQKEYTNVLSKPYFQYDSNLRPSDINEERFLIALVENFQKRAILKAKNENFYLFFNEN